MGGYFSSKAWIQSKAGIIRILFSDMDIGEANLFGVQKEMEYLRYDGELEEVIPSEKQWKVFLEVLKITDAWKKEYEDMHICDGTQWSLDIYFKLPEGKRKLKRIYGSNEFPADFDTFAKALSKLIQYSKLKNRYKFEFWQFEVD